MAATAGDNHFSYRSARMNGHDPYAYLEPAVPFGGVKRSGIGREFGSAFIDDYTELMMRF